MTKKPGEVHLMIRLDEELHWKMKLDCATKKISIQKFLENYIKSVYGNS